MSKKQKKTEQILEAALKLFSTKGFYSTTIPDIAKSMSMSVGNMYNYFSSKEALAKEIIKYSSDVLGAQIREINDSELSSKEKIYAIVKAYFTVAQEHPEHTDYFLRVYLANKEVFKEGCEGMLCVSSFVTEFMIFFEDAVSKGDLRDQDFFTAFGLFMGYLGGFAFLSGEGVLNKDLLAYTDEIAQNIYNALKTDA